MPTGVLIPADRSGSDHRFFLKLKKMVKYGTSKNLQLLLKKLYFCDKCFLCVGFWVWVGSGSEWIYFKIRINTGYISASVTGLGVMHVSSASPTFPHHHHHPRYSGSVFLCRIKKSPGAAGSWAEKTIQKRHQGWSRTKGGMHCKKVFLKGACTVKKVLKGSLHWM